MKWYTLEERPLNKDERGLFYCKDDKYSFIEMGRLCDDNSGGHSKIDEDIPHLRTESNAEYWCPAVELKEIKYWMPIEELKAMLPKE